MRAFALQQLDRVCLGERDRLLHGYGSIKLQKAYRKCLQIRYGTCLVLGERGPASAFDLEAA